MNKAQQSIALAGVLAFSLSAGAVNAAENPFAMKVLASGYQVADSDMAKSKEGQCSAGKCSASMKEKMSDKAEIPMAGESTGAKPMEAKPMEKVHEGSCSAEKMKDGGCNAEMRKDMHGKPAKHKKHSHKKHGAAMTKDAAPMEMAK